MNVYGDTGGDEMCGPKPCDKPDCTWGESHRAACEARAVLQWPREQRAEYYEKVRRWRGQEAAQRLIADVRREWEKIA